jgi:hypothetical protein
MNDQMLENLRWRDRRPGSSYHGHQGGSKLPFCCVCSSGARDHPKLEPRSVPRVTERARGGGGGGGSVCRDGKPSGVEAEEWPGGANLTRVQRRALMSKLCNGHVPGTWVKHEHCWPLKAGRGPAASGDHGLLQVCAWWPSLWQRRQWAGLVHAAATWLVHRQLKHRPTRSAGTDRCGGGGAGVEHTATAFDAQPAANLHGQELVAVERQPGLCLRDGHLP